MKNVTVHQAEVGDVHQPAWPAAQGVARTLMQTLSRECYAKG